MATSTTTTTPSFLTRSVRFSDEFPTRKERKKRGGGIIRKENIIPAGREWNAQIVSRKGEAEKSQKLTPSSYWITARLIAVRRFALLLRWFLIERRGWWRPPSYELLILSEAINVSSLTSSLTFEYYWCQSRTHVSAPSLVTSRA